MPSAPPRLCPKPGHPPYKGGRGCPLCEAKRLTLSRAEHDARRPSAPQRGYGPKWRQARADFLAKHPACVACGKPATVVDHDTPHKGDMALFWRRSNWQAMCASCHSAKTNRSDGGFGRPAIGKAQ